MSGAVATLPTPAAPAPPAGRSDAAETVALRAVGARVADLLADRPPVGVAELVDQAALLRRFDRKYVVPSAAVVTLLEHLPADIAVLRIDDVDAFGYDTVYFDTPDLRAYLDAARSRPARWKVRVRTYLDSGDVWCEVKVRDRRGETIKHRRPRHHGTGASLRLAEPPGPTVAASALHHVEQRFVTTAAPGIPVDHLIPVLRTRYRRVTLLDRATRSRITIDDALCCEDAGGAVARFAGSAIVETKAPGGPSAIDRTLWRLGHRPRRFSKYATGLAALHPELPANRWHQTLVRTHPLLEGRLP